MSWLAAATAASAALNYFGANRTNQANARMAHEQMDFQERMSNTSHAREVEDLENAGLNPILSARYGGSSTPVGAMATMSNPVASATDAGLRTFSAGLEAERNPSVVIVNQANARRANEAATLDVEQQEVARRTAQKIGIENTLIEAETAKIIYELREVLPSIKALNDASSSERAQMAWKISSYIEHILPLEIQNRDIEIKMMKEELKTLAMKGEVSESNYAKIMEYISRLPGIGGFLSGIGVGAVIPKRDLKKRYNPN